jgi:hypothetical protein
VARFDTWSRERPVFVRGLGHAGADLPAVPAVWVTRDGIVVAWCEEDGAWVRALDLAGAAVGRPALAVPGATAVAFAAGRARATLFAADADGVAALEVGPDGRPAGEPLRAVAERRAGAMLAATRIRDEAVLVYGHRGVEGWGVASVRGGEVTAVKHDSAPCEAVHAQGVGSRAAVVLELRGGRVRFGLLGPGARVIERPHPVFAPGVPPLAAPQVVWTDDDWTLLAHEPGTDRLRVQPSSERLAPFVLPRCAGPFAAGYWVQHLFALEVEPDASGAELRLWRCARDGSEPQQRVTPLALDDRHERRVRLEARQALGDLAYRVGGARGYRSRPTRPELSRDGGTLRLRDGEGRLRVRLEPAREARLSMRITSALGDEPSLPETPSSLVRLARWIRERLSAEARQRAEAERAWARELARALDASLRDVQRAGDTVVLHLALDAPPEAERLQRWLRRLREEQARRHAR